MKKNLVILFFVISIFVPTFMSADVDCDLQLKHCLLYGKDLDICYAQYDACLYERYSI